MFPSTVASIEYIRAGRLRALAVTTAMRSGSASERSFHSPARTRRRLGGGSASARPRTRRPRSSRSSTRRSTRSWAPHGVPLAPRACPGVCQRTVQRRPPAQRCAGAELFRRPRRSRNRYRLGGFGPVGQGLVRPPLRRVTGSRKADSLDPREPRTWSPEGLAVARVRAAWVRALGFERLGQDIHSARIAGGCSSLRGPSFTGPLPTEKTIGIRGLGGQRCRFAAGRNDNVPIIAEAANKATRHVVRISLHPLRVCPFNSRSRTARAVRIRVPPLSD
jgi:hypothetical protein